MLSMAAMSDFSRILILQGREIGDVLLSTPLVRVVREAFPKARIDYYVEPQACPMIERNPHIDRLVTRDQTGGSGFFSDWKRLRHVSYDLVIDLLFNSRTAILCRSALPDAIRLSFAGRWRSQWYSHVAPIEELYAGFAKQLVLVPLQIVPKRYRPELVIEDGLVMSIANEINGWGIGAGNPLVVIDMTHKDRLRRWPAERYRQLADQLVEKRGVVAIFVYGPGEESYVRDALGGGPGTHIIPPRQLDLYDLAALLSLADLLIGNCSAPRHIAVAQQTPTLVMHGASSPIRFTFPDEWNRYLAATPGGVTTAVDATAWVPGDIRKISLEQALEEAIRLLDDWVISAKRSR